MSPEKDPRKQSNNSGAPSSEGAAHPEEVPLTLSTGYQESSAAEIIKLLKAGPEQALRSGTGSATLLGLLNDSERRKFVSALGEIGATWEEVAENSITDDGPAVQEVLAIHNLVCQRFTHCLIEAVGDPCEVVQLLIRRGEPYYFDAGLDFVSLPTLLSACKDPAAVPYEKFGILFNAQPFGYPGPGGVHGEWIRSRGLEDALVGVVEGALKAPEGNHYANRIVKSLEALSQSLSPETMERLEHAVSTVMPAAWIQVFEPDHPRALPRLKSVVEATPERGANPQYQMGFCLVWIGDDRLPASARKVLVDKLIKLVENYPEFIRIYRKELSKSLGAESVYAIVRNRLEKFPCDALVLDSLTFLKTLEGRKVLSSIVAQRFSDNPRLAVLACERCVAPQSIPGFKSVASVISEVLAAEMPLDLHALASNKEFLQVVLNSTHSRSQFFGRLIQTGSAHTFYSVAESLQAASYSIDVPFDKIRSSMFACLDAADDRANEIRRDSRFFRWFPTGGELTKGCSYSQSYLEVLSFLRIRDMDVAPGMSDFGVPPTSTFFYSLLLYYAAPLNLGSNGHHNDHYIDRITAISTNITAWYPAASENRLCRFVFGSKLGAEFDQFLASNPVCSRILEGRPVSERLSSKTWAELTADVASAAVAGCLFEELPLELRREALTLSTSDLTDLLALLEIGRKHGFDDISQAPDLQTLQSALRAHATAWIAEKAAYPLAVIEDGAKDATIAELRHIVDTLEKLHWFYPEWKSVFVDRVFDLAGLSKDGRRSANPGAVNARDTMSNWSAPVSISIEKDGRSFVATDQLTTKETLLAWKPYTDSVWGLYPSYESALTTVLDASCLRTVVVIEGARTIDVVQALLGHDGAGRSGLLLDLVSGQPLAQTSMEALLAWGDEKARALKVPLRPTPSFIQALPYPLRGRFTGSTDDFDSSRLFIEVPNRTRHVTRLSTECVAVGELCS